MGTKGKPSSKKRKSRARNVPPFPFKFRLKVARLREEGGYPALMIAEQFGISEYSVPKEMLTDNRRQYTNWRDTTRFAMRFEKELTKDRVKHIRSRPHHPMTLGKIERFWQSILTEFLQRAQFTIFEDDAGRIAFWVKYYTTGGRIRASPSYVRQVRCGGRFGSVR